MKTLSLFQITSRLLKLLLAGLAFGRVIRSGKNNF
jgi:hypothetical protein